jgi:hypothetical protein
MGLYFEAVGNALRNSALPSTIATKALLFGAVPHQTWAPDLKEIVLVSMEIWLFGKSSLAGGYIAGTASKAS